MLRARLVVGPKRCAIDYEGASSGVSVEDNYIHDSYGAGVMVFGLSDPSANITNASIRRNVSRCRVCLMCFAMCPLWQMFICIFRAG